MWPARKAFFYQKFFKKSPLTNMHIPRYTLRFSWIFSLKTYVFYETYFGKRRILCREFFNFLKKTRFIPFVLDRLIVHFSKNGSLRFSAKSTRTFYCNIAINGLVDFAKKRKVSLKLVIKKMRKIPKSQFRVRTSDFDVFQNYMAFWCHHLRQEYRHITQNFSKI